MYNLQSQDLQKLKNDNSFIIIHIKLIVNITLYYIIRIRIYFNNIARN